MDVNNLSDHQLYALVLNESLPTELKGLVTAEFERRNFSQEHIDDLAIAYELKAQTGNDDLQLWQKITIVLFPFFAPLQAILANRYISKGQPFKWKQYWKYLAFGYLLWTVLVLAFVKFFLKW